MRVPVISNGVKPYPIFLLAVAVMVIVNTIDLVKTTIKFQQFRKHFPYSFAGQKFAGLESILKDNPMIGYYTDKDLNQKQPAMQFAQAQLVLAPAILDTDINNPRHQFILFDCTTEKKALQKIQALGLIPLKRNNRGIILAKRP